MNKTSPAYWLVALCASLLLTGCKPRVSYAVMNSSAQRLSNVVVRSNSGFVFEHGVLIGGTHSSFSGTMELQKENKLTISWSSGAGGRQEKTVIVSGSLLKDKRMRVFTITPSMEIEESWRWED